LLSEIILIEIKFSPSTSLIYVLNFSFSFLNFSISFLSFVFAPPFNIFSCTILFNSLFFISNSFIYSDLFVSSNTFEDIFIKSRNAFDLNFYYIKNIIYILNNLLIIIIYTFLKIKLIKNKITGHLKKIIFKVNSIYFL